MKISAISYNIYKTTRQDFKTDKMTVDVLKSNLASDVVSFSSNTPKNQKLFIDDFREIPDLPCGCCGKKMLKNSTVNEFIGHKLYYPANIALRKIKTQGLYCEKNATNAEKEAYSYLIAYANLNPRLTMNDILSKRAVKIQRQSMSQEASAAFDKFRELSKLIARPSKYVVAEIANLKPDFHKVEKKVFKDLQKYSKKYPSLTLQQILNKPEIYNNYLHNLQKKQMKVLDRIEQITETAPSELQDTIKGLTNSARLIFSQESAEILHKRGRVISSYEDNLKKYKDNETISKIILIINDLPNSMTDVDAFMVKSAQKNSNSTAETLICRQRNTFEHVKPRRREKDNGPNKISNYIGLCGKCNTERQRTQYDIFIKSHPEMPKNEQRQINKIIRYINRGELIGYNDYPADIQEALKIESKGKLMIDIEKYDEEKAKTSRKIRQDLFIALKKAEARLKAKKSNNTIG